jgi:glycosyltransferase involved in cell wall biosynthesis
LAAALGQLSDLRWQLLLVGTGEFAEPLRALLAANGLTDRVQFAGYVPHEEAPRWLAALDILVLPSETQPNWSEQFGRVIPEALACGVPVIGSDSGEIPNLIRSSGGGLVFAERNPAALAEALRRLIIDADLRRSLASTGRHWVEQEMALPAVAAKMISAFRRVQPPTR